jgi:hypothetical protein
MEQMFRLSGEAMDLDDLADLFQTGRATVKKIEEYHYLHLEMEPVRDDKEALAAAETVLARINAIAIVVLRKISTQQRSTA